MPLESRVKIYMQITSRGEEGVKQRNKIKADNLHEQKGGYLIFHFVDVAVDGGEQLLPAHPQRLHRVFGVLVLQNDGLLLGLPVLLQLVDVRPEGLHRGATGRQLLQRLLQGL